MRIVTIIVAAIILIPLTSSGFTGSGIIANAEAASACKGDWQPVVWNSTMQRVAEVPFSWNNYYDYYYYEDDGYGNSNSKNQEDYPLSPELPHMYQYNRNIEWLSPLTGDYSTSMLVGNDSVGALRFNLSSAHRTTFCVTLTELNDGEETSIDGDVYLMTATQYRSYAEAYSRSHNQQDWWGEVEDTLKNIDPEWRSFDILGWRTYRDAHEYENVDDIALSVSLDGPEYYSNFFGGSGWEHFYLVVDTWDNSHDSDANAPDSIVHADVSIVTTKRTFVLPAWTVSIAFIGIVGALMVAPILVNRKYMGAGLGETQEELVPSLEMAPTLQPDGQPIEHPDKVQQVMQQQEIQQQITQQQMAQQQALQQQALQQQIGQQ